MIPDAQSSPRAIQPAQSTPTCRLGRLIAKPESWRCRPWRLQSVGVALGLFFAGLTPAPLLSQQSPTHPALQLLTNACLACHNSTAKMSGLDLSTRESALAGGGKGPALVPGDPKASLLYQRVAAGEMPPGDPLPTEAKAALHAWIADGADWTDALANVDERPRADPNWWSLQPLSKARPPQTDEAPESWRRSPIDRFIYAELQKKGLRPAPRADRRVLIRRATFDLLGLPPTPEQVEAFVNDADDEGAYERLIDRLLASPQYGERWGRHWLDVVRFGESHGYEQNHLRNNAWPYRDYVIRSFNEDKPFDLAVLEQLAGDQIAAGNPDVTVATGFLVAGPHDTVGIENIEGKLQQRANDLDDMIRATAESFLGLTVGCARCHDHKFDPILQSDYYKMRAVFEGVRHEERVWAAPEQQQRYRLQREPVESELREVEARLAALKQRVQPLVEKRRDAVFARFRAPIDAKGVEEIFEPINARYVRMKITETNRGPAALDEFEIWSAGPSSQNVALASAGAKAVADSTREDNGDSTFYRTDFLIDGEFDSPWISGETGKGQITIELEKTRSISRIFWSRDHLGANQGRFNGSTPTAYVVEASADGATWTKVADSKDRLPFDEAAREEMLLRAVFTGDETRQWDQLRKSKAELDETLADMPELPKAYIGGFQQPDEPTYLFQRGNPMTKGDVVPPASPSTLDALLPGFELDPAAPEGERRLALARWITDDRNALTPRVLANRVWHYHFGRGLAGTPSDFGFNGLRPSHPGLLDWLARRVQTFGWRLKPFHKEIMMSETYRQSSAYDSAYAEVDSDAQYLWRFPPRRLEAEEIRDSILAVAGTLRSDVGGPSYRLYKYTVDNVATYLPLEDFEPETFRRSVYHQSARSVSVDLLGQYDQPDCSYAAPKREASTSPLQALSLMNNQFVLDQARSFAARLEQEAGRGDAAAQTERAYGLAFGRPPTASEREASLEFIDQHGLLLFCRALINANEFIYVM